MLSAAGCDQPQHLIARQVRIINDFAMVIANDAPFVGASCEGAVLNQVGRRCARRFDDADIIEPYLARIEQSHYKLMPLSVGPYRTGGSDPAIGVGAPARAPALIAAGPGFGCGIIRARISQLETRAASIRGGRPAPVVEVMHDIGGIIGGVFQNDSA